MGGNRSKEQASFAKASEAKGVRSKKPEARSQESGGMSFSLVVVICCLVICGCGGRAENNKPVDSSPKFTQYYNQGEQLYQKYCCNCHQKDGTGLGRVYPPLNVSDYMDNHFNDVICLMRYGKKGEVTVNNVNFHQPMPGIPALTDLEIAEIATYIYNTWTHQRGIIEVKDASAILNTCPSSE